MMLEFFNKEPTYMQEIEHFDKDGNLSRVSQKEVATQCPTFERFCANLLISRQTFHVWVKKYPEFNDAYQASREMQANIMMVNGMNGLYNSGFTGLSMKNMHGWADKQEVDNVHTVNQMPLVKIAGKPLMFDVGEDVEGEDGDD